MGEPYGSGFAPPPAAPPEALAERIRDDEHLRMLAIFYYVVAAITALFSLFPLLHVAIGVWIVLGGFPTGGGPPPPFDPGWFFVVLGGAFVLVGETIALLTYLAARRISERRSRTFILVVAGIHCLNMPLGTALGVFTFITLLRDSVARHFDEHAVR